MVRLRCVHRCGARPVGSQAGTAPDPVPQMGPPTATGSNPGDKIRQRPVSDQLTSTLSSEPASLVFAQWNAEGLRNKKPELQDFLKTKKIDIICIQETHLTDAHRFFIRGYELFRQDRVNRHKGGLVTLVRNTIPAVQIEQSDCEGTEHITVKIILPSCEIIVVNCYCSPDKDLKLQHIPVREKGLLILGDFNSHSPSWGYDSTNSRGEQVEDWMIENRLILVNKPDDKPTCYSRAWKTTSHPDLAIATDDLHRICEKSVEGQLGGSDHLPVLLRLETKDQPENPRREAS